MIIIQDILVSDDIISKMFHCDLMSCKGACCWEGDYGAPLEAEEIEQLETDYASIATFLTEEGRAVIEDQGKFTYYKEAEENGTPLINGSACAYLNYDEKGIAQCGIEQAHQAGKTSFKKPISCHLYPIRVNSNKRQGFEALNYDIWGICKAACHLGKEKQIAIYQFVKEAIVRKYGLAFYDELDAAAKYIATKTEKN